ncbi:MAG: anthranilate/aminodeoxychorismate synthase component II [Candidatus Moranbacteria bacterium]|nr:anthranilate/aminodeoxychorismate synthase component II [Candidatus Moranbacteria bacterium]
MKILILDNYDSFTYNLYQYIGEILIAKNIGFDIEVKRNDEISIQEIKSAKFDRIIISPGPGSPDDPQYFGVCAKVITQIGKITPVLGVCLGMQGIAHYFGGKVIRAKNPMHGKTSLIEHDGKGVLKNLPQNLEVMRYHSLIPDPLKLPDSLEVSVLVKTKNTKACLLGNEKLNSQDEVMGLRHKKYPICGVQFHPESFATEGGRELLENFLFIKH